uniref:ribosomal protein S19 n=1 Tax=Haslea karadagensis TaxID=1146996 RepID=UPI0021FCEFCB|nr:ribosomal protein S19 [Haslea karadagensis]UXN44285.1 ribosomal protein S19 [Haslea karadagensis]UXN44326.1 ribosomal protein S19 [Haslea karadagensis]UXN44366.1 ribosomal protein S19 [Haslea karadagensis]
MKRSRWKSLYIKPQYLKQKQSENSQISRNSSILPKFIGLTFQVYSGRIYKKVIVNKEMVGHKFGEFSQTRAVYSFKKNKKKK